MTTEELIRQAAGANRIDRSAIRAPAALNEAMDYGAAFSRGMRLEFGNVVVLLISGTASIDHQGRTLHAGNFRAQLRRALDNVTALLAAEGATWKDIVRTSYYLRDMERDYATFNDERTKFFREQGIELYPASTAIQAVLCRSDLLVELEAIAIFLKRSA